MVSRVLRVLPSPMPTRTCLWSFLTSEWHGSH